MPTGSGGSGTWDTGTTANWSNGSSDTTWTDTTATVELTPGIPVVTPGYYDSAVFGGLAGTVSIGASPSSPAVSAVGLKVNTTGYVIGSPGSTNVLQIGARNVASAPRPFLDLSALSSGNLTVNAPVDVGGVSASTTNNLLVMLGNNTVNFNGLRNVAGTECRVTLDGTGTLVLNNSTNGAYGSDPLALAVSADSSASRRWVFQSTSAATAGANVTVNGRITNYPAVGGSVGSTSTGMTFSTGGTLRLNDTSSDIATNWTINNGSTLSLGGGNGATAGTGILGAPTTTVILGVTSSSPSTAATVRFDSTSPITLGNNFTVSGNNSTIPITFNSVNNTNVKLDGTISNYPATGYLNVNRTGSGTFELAGRINISAATSTKSLVLLGNAPILLSGTTANSSDANAAVAGTLTYSGTSVLTIGPTATLGHTTNGTKVTSGTLLMNSAIAGGAAPFSASGTGTLGGIGTIAGTVTINGGSFLAPGNSGVGTLTTNSGLFFVGASTYSFEINSTTGIADKMVANGATVSATALFAFADLGNGSGVSNGQTFLVLDNTGTGTLTPFANLANGSTILSNGVTYTANYSGGTGNDLVLIASGVAVPEPSAVATIGLAGLAAARRRRR